ncbi:MAG: PHB depolymerase family esterase [Acidimicrobiales bacterium]
MALLLVTLTLILSLPGGAAGDGAMVVSRPAEVSTVSLEVGGVARRTLVVEPPADSVAARQRPPLLIVLHGVGGQGADMRHLGFEELASDRGVIVAYPDAFRGSWNDGRPGMEPASPGDVVDDVAFLRALVVELGSRAGADTHRVAVAGFSNGALMTGRLACELPDGLVAVGLVAGTVGEGFTASCRPNRPLPVVLVAGTADAIVPYGGGQIADFAGRKRGRVASAEEFVAFWAATNRCPTSVETPVPGAAVPVTRREAQGCASTASVVHYRIGDGGHDWYRVSGFDTTAAVWGFLAPWLGAGTVPDRP